MTGHFRDVAPLHSPDHGRYLGCRVGEASNLGPVEIHQTRRIGDDEPLVQQDSTGSCQSEAAASALVSIALVLGQRHGVRRTCAAAAQIVPQQPKMSQRSIVTTSGRIFERRRVASHVRLSQADLSVEGVVDSEGGSVFPRPHPADTERGVREGPSRTDFPFCSPRRWMVQVLKSMTDDAAVQVVETPRRQPSRRVVLNPEKDTPRSIQDQQQDESASDGESST